MKSFEELVKNDRYQVFLFTCPATLPFSFGVHPWFVVNRKGNLSRWEVWWRPSQCKTSWGHLHVNLLPVTQALRIFLFSKRFLWKGRLLNYIEGEEGSLAHKMAEFIEASDKNYPYCYRYFLAAPNSNTYVQRVLNHFPESNMRLPWNSIGKKFQTH